MMRCILAAVGGRKCGGPSVGELAVCGPGGARCIGGVSSSQALAQNRRTCRCDRDGQRCWAKRSLSRSCAPTATGTGLGEAPMTRWLWLASVVGARIGCSISLATSFMVFGAGFLVSDRSVLRASTVALSGYRPHPLAGHHHGHLDSGRGGGDRVGPAKPHSIRPSRVRDGRQRRGGPPGRSPRGSGQGRLVCAGRSGRRAGRGGLVVRARCRRCHRTTSASCSA